jgi:ethanolamine ammonia-lyase large subunit/amino acid transporter
MTEDVKLLHSMGYAQDLLRRMSGFSNFAISFSIICILAGGITSLQLGISAVGGAAAGIVWPIGVGLCFLVALTMAQVASAFPTAGGLYHWSSILGGKGWGWATAWFNFGGVVFVTAAVNVGDLQPVHQFHRADARPRPAKLTVTHQIIGVTVITISQAAFNHFGIRAVTLLTDFSGYLIFAVAIMLTVAMLAFAPSHDFGRLFTFTNYSGDAGGGVWPQQGSTVTDDPARPDVADLHHHRLRRLRPHRRGNRRCGAQCPAGLLRSVYLSGLFGWVMVSAFVLALPSLAEGAKQGGNIFPWLMEQVIPGTFGKVLWVGIVFSNYLCGLACVTSTSRMAYAFARDGGLPASGVLKKVSPKWKTPVAAIWTTAVLTIASTLYAPAYSTLTAACVIFLYVSYVMPAMAGFFAYGKTWRKMGPFDLGPGLYKTLAVISTAFVGLIIWIGIQPPNDLALNALLGSVIVLTLAWWLGVRKVFKGPPVMSIASSAPTGGRPTSRRPRSPSEAAPGPPPRMSTWSCNSGRAGEGRRRALRRRARRRRRRERGGARRRPAVPRRCAARALPRGAADSLRGRRGHAADRRHARRGGLRPVASLTVGEFRDWLLRYETDRPRSPRSPRPHAGDGRRRFKLMSNQDLILVASKCRVVTAFRNTARPARPLSVRLQPNHPTDDPRGIAASILDGLLYGCGDAVIGINPATDSLPASRRAAALLDELIRATRSPRNPACSPTSPPRLRCMKRARRSISFSSPSPAPRPPTAASASTSRCWPRRARRARAGRGTVGDNVMYFETGQGSALSANAHHGVDQQTSRSAPTPWPGLPPLLVNTVVGFIGPEYLYDGKQIIRAGLEDHFCGKLLGLPMGCDVCYTNHAEADQDDMDTLLTLLGVAGVQLHHGRARRRRHHAQLPVTSFHDSQYLRQVLGLKPAPEFEAWLAIVSRTSGRKAWRLPPPPGNWRNCCSNPPAAASAALPSKTPDPSPHFHLPELRRVSNRLRQRRAEVSGRKAGRP